MPVEEVDAGRRLPAAQNSGTNTGLNTRAKLWVPLMLIALGQMAYVGSGAIFVENFRLDGGTTVYVFVSTVLCILALMKSGLLKKVRRHQFLLTDLLVTTLATGILLAAIPPYYTHYPLPSGELVLHDHVKLASFVAVVLGFVFLLSVDTLLPMRTRYLRAGGIAGMACGCVLAGSLPFIMVMTAIRKESLRASMVWIDATLYCTNDECVFQLWRIGLLSLTIGFFLFVCSAIYPGKPKDMHATNAK